jgi:hypothetical protein
MNVPVINRDRLRRAVEAIERRYSLRVSGVLPNGIVEHPETDTPVTLLAERGSGLTLLDLSSAEVDLQKEIGAPTRILLRTEIEGTDRAAVLALSRPL